MPGASLDTEAVVDCPHCGEAVTISLDVGGGPLQSYDEDCHVCCRPWRVTVRFDDEGAAAVEVESAY